MKVGIQLTWSKLRANTPLMKPASEKMMAVSSTATIVAIRWWTGRCVKKSATTVTAPPTSNPRSTPPPTYPATMIQLGSGATMISSR